MCADFTTHSYAPHVHEAFVVAVTETGGAEIKSRGQVGQAHASRLFAFNPGEPHSGWMGASHSWRYRGFYLPQPAIRAVAEGLGIDRIPYFLRNDFTDADLVAGFLQLHRRLQSADDTLAEREALLAAFGMLFDRHGDGGERPAAPPGDRALFERLRKIMAERQAEALTLDGLGREFGLTEFQLIGLFNRVIGITPYAYLTQLRLNTACRLLKRHHPIAEAALAAGFYDQSALTKHFKRCYGITPLQFAKAAA
ncbi:AraC family transcriptional regulator [Phreatobacter stygius]|uniref:AraC family transcriptional regulator n=2 Tax=Phreatobacter stygius TaxID=1940610 RepID=A0A4D7BJG2_9HYPH|nr:AraC family transcriptional regulator [Phreatobacter stygius]